MTGEARNFDLRFNHTNVLENDEESDSFSTNSNFLSMKSEASEVGDSGFDFNLEGRNTFGITWPAYGLDDSNGELEYLKNSADSIDLEELNVDTENYEMDLPIDINSLFEIDSNYGMSSESESDDDKEDESDDDTIEENEVMKFAKDPDDPDGRDVRKITKSKIGDLFEKLEIPETVEEEGEEAEFHQFLTEMQQELGLFLKIVCP